MKVRTKEEFLALIDELNKMVAERENGLLLWFEDLKGVPMDKTPVFVKKFVGICGEKTVARECEPVGDKPPASKRYLKKNARPTTVEEEYFIFASDGEHKRLSFVIRLHGDLKKLKIEVKVKKRCIVVTEQGGRVGFRMNCTHPAPTAACKKAFEYVLDEPQGEDDGDILVIREFQRQELDTLVEMAMARDEDLEIEGENDPCCLEEAFNIGGQFEIVEGRWVVFLSAQEVLTHPAICDTLHSAVIACDKRDVKRYSEVIEMLEEGGVLVKVFS